MRSSLRLFKADEEERIVALARSRSVCVETEKDYGTGVIFITGLVITAWHNVKDAKTLKVNNKPAKVIHRNLRQDLAALAVEMDEQFECLRVVSPRIRQRVGFVFAVMDKSKGCGAHFVPTFGEVVHFEGDSVYANVFTEPGSCGTPLMTRSGMVGIVDSGVTFAATQAVAGKVVKRFAAQAYRYMHRPNVPRIRFFSRKRRTQLPLPTFQQAFDWNAE